MDLKRFGAYIRTNGVITEAYVSPVDAIKGLDYSCPDCGQDLILKKGDINIHHFAHKMQGSCVYYDKPSESQIHKEAKRRLTSILRSKDKQITITHECQGCIINSPHSICNIEPVDENTRIVMEHQFTYDGGSKYADVAYLMGQELKYIFEVFYTHRTKEEDRPDPWFEIDAESILKIDHTSNTITFQCCRRRCPINPGYNNLVVTDTTFETILTIMNSRNALTIATPTYHGPYSTFQKLQTALRYLYHQLNTPWPCKSAQQFNSALKDYHTRTPNMFLDFETIAPKVLISYPQNFVDQAYIFSRENKPTTEATMKTMTPERFNALPSACDIPRELFERYGTFIGREQPWVDVPDIKLLWSTARGRKIITTYLIAVPGRGKTTTIVRYCSSISSGMPIVCFSFRIGEASKLVADFYIIGVEHYKLIETYIIDLKDHPRTVMQIDSIARFRGKFEGILILDEVESILEHIHQSPLMKNPQSVANIMTSFIRSASHVFVADANCKMSTVRYISEICGRPIEHSYFYKNETIRDTRKIYFLNGKADLVQRTIEKLLSGEAVYMPTNSRAFGLYAIDTIQKACSNVATKLFDKNTILITTDKDGKPVDPIAEFKEYYCVVATPTLQAGNSFVEPHFHHCFAYATGASSSPEAFSQLIMRVRSVIDKDLYLYVDNRLGQNKKVDRSINSFDDMIEKYRAKNRTMCDEHDINLSKGQILKLRWTAEDTIDLRDPFTFIEMASSYNLNEGYKNYTDRLLSILKAYGFEYGESLVTNSDQARQAESAFNKGVRAMNKETELAPCRQIASVPLPTLEQADDIIARLRQLDRGQTPTTTVQKVVDGETVYERVEAPVTEIERAQVKKYNLFRTNDIRLPDTANPEQILSATKFVYKRKLISYFIPLVIIPVIRALEPNRCLDIVEYLLRDIDQQTTHALEDPNPNVSTKKYNTLKTADRILYHSYIISYLNILGFEYTFFDTNTIDIANTKPVLSNNLRTNIDQYNVIFGRSAISNMGGKHMMKWLNDNLNMYGIKLKRIETRSEQWCIDSPWQLVIELGQVKVRHQEETQVSSEQYKASFNVTFLDQLFQSIHIATMPHSIYACVAPDSAYDNKFRIVDRVGWNYYIQRAKREKNTTILEYAKPIKELEDNISHFELMRKDDPHFTWTMYKDRMSHNTINIPLPSKTYPLQLVLINNVT